MIISVRNVASWINAIRIARKTQTSPRHETSPARAVPSLRLSFLSLNLREEIKQIYTHTYATREREKDGCGQCIGDRTKETASVKCVTRVKRCLRARWRFIAAYDCVPIRLVCASGFGSDYVHKGLLQPIAMLVAACNARRVLLALIRRLLKGGLYSRVTRRETSDGRTCIRVAMANECFF